MRKSKPIQWEKYPVRKCQTMHTCVICITRILFGESYFDGGYGKRARSVRERREKDGFGREELRAFLGHEPKTFKPLEKP